MKKHLLYLLAVTLLLSTGALTAQNNVKTCALDPFSIVNLAGGFDHVTFEAGNAPKLIIESNDPKIDLSEVEAQVHKNTLNIDMARNRASRMSKIRITIIYTELKSVNNSGTTDITFKPMKAEEFTFNSSGSGDMQGEFEVQKLSVNVSGSADMTLSGKARDQYFAVSGSGDINATDLRGETADVAVSGSGDVTLNVSGKVRSAVSGSGNIDNRRRQ